METSTAQSEQTDELAEKYLTTKEVAALLHVKERKIYDLAAAGDIPGIRALGKWLFERAAIEAWLSQHSNGPDLSVQLRPNVVLGSHDPLLEWAVRESGSGLAMFLDGSRDGLKRFVQREGIVAGLHLHKAEDGDWNVADVRAALPDDAAVLVEWAWRQRGFVVAEGNPQGIQTMSDLAGKRVASRQDGAGAQILLGELLATAGLGPEQVKILPASRSENDAALSVMEEDADMAFGLKCLARQFRLDFVPVIKERFDILVSHRDWFEPPMQRLMAFTKTDAFARKAQSLTGYDISGLGTVQFNGDTA